MAASTRKTAKQAAAEEAVSGATERSLEEEIKQLQKDVAKLTEQLAKTGRHSYDAARKAAAVGMDQIKSQGEVRLWRFSRGSRKSRGAIDGCGT